MLGNGGFFHKKITTVVEIERQMYHLLLSRNMAFLTSKYQWLGSQLANTCSKLAIEALKQGRYIFQVNNRDTRMTSFASFLCFYFKLRIDFTPCSSTCTVNFEKVNAGWDVYCS